jgi:hypothetical protein
MTVWPGMSLVVETSMSSPLQTRNMKIDQRSGKAKAKLRLFAGAAIVTRPDSVTTTR